jgi:hypothetical protein
MEKWRNHLFVRSEPMTPLEEWYWENTGVRVILSSLFTERRSFDIALGLLFFIIFQNTGFSITLFAIIICLWVLYLTVRSSRKIDQPVYQLARMVDVDVEGRVDEVSDSFWSFAQNIFEQGVNIESVIHGQVSIWKWLNQSLVLVVIGLIFIFINFIAISILTRAWDFYILYFGLAVIVVDFVLLLLFIQFYLFYGDMVLQVLKKLSVGLEYTLDLSGTTYKEEYGVLTESLFVILLRFIILAIPALIVTGFQFPEVLPVLSVLLTVGFVIGCIWSLIRIIPQAKSRNEMSRQQTSKAIKYISKLVELKLRRDVIQDPDWNRGTRESLEAAGFDVPTNAFQLGRR